MTCEVYNIIDLSLYVVHTRVGDSEILRNDYCLQNIAIIALEYLNGAYYHQHV